MGGDKTMCRLLWTFMSPEEPPTPIPPKHLSVSGAKFLGHVARFSCISMTNHVKSCKQFNEVGRRTEFKYLLRGTRGPTAKKIKRKKLGNKKGYLSGLLLHFQSVCETLEDHIRNPRSERWYDGGDGGDCWLNCLNVFVLWCICVIIEIYLIQFWNLFQSEEVRSSSPVGRVGNQLLINLWNVFV